MTPEFDKIYKSLIQESITISVSDSESRSNHIGDISSKIQYGKAFSNFYDKFFTKEQKEIFQKEKVSDFITIDGYDYLEGAGAINFYTRGFPENLFLL
jgi:hypothetical protein